jgi:hypothetical protein
VKNLHRQFGIKNLHRQVGMKNLHRKVGMRMEQTHTHSHTHTHTHSLFRNVGISNSDAGALPRRKHIKFKHPDRRSF